MCSLKCEGRARPCLPAKSRRRKKVRQLKTAYAAELERQSKWQSRSVLMHVSETRWSALRRRTRRQARQRTGKIDVGKSALSTGSDRIHKREDARSAVGSGEWTRKFCLFQISRPAEKQRTKKKEKKEKTNNSETRINRIWKRKRDRLRTSCRDDDTTTDSTIEQADGNYLKMRSIGLPSLIVIAKLRNQNVAENQSDNKLGFSK